MSPQLVGGWGQAEPLAAGEEGGAWPPTASSHRREQAPGAQPALGRSACFWHQKGVVVSCQCPGPQVGLHRGPAPGPATGAAPQLQALSRHRPLLYLALDLSASQLLYQTEFLVAGSQGPLRSKPKEQSAWCVLALQGLVSTEPPPWRPAPRSRRSACLRGGEGLPWVPDTCLSDAQDFRFLPPEGPFLLRLLICLVAQGRGVCAGWGSGLREQTAPGSEAPNTGRT